MVNADDIYLVVSTIAITHEVPAVSKVNVKELEQFLSPPITVGVGLEGSMIGCQREQIEIVTANVKTDVRDLSGQKDFSGSKVGTILNYFVTNFGLKVNSYGVNFGLRVSCSAPRKWMIENILSSRISEKTGRKLVGGAAAVSLEAEGKTWNMKFESVDDEKLAVDFNASKKTVELPGADVLSGELKTQWELLVKFLGDLGL